MSIHIDNCPRCKAKKTTFDVLYVAFRRTLQSYPELYLLEAPLQCRNCKGISVIELVARKKTIVNDANESNKQRASLSDFLEVRNFITLADIEVTPPPEHLPPYVQSAFTEGTKCYATGCYNAAGAMFRLSLDLASKSQLPTDDTLTTHRQKNILAERLEWLFDNKHWPASLKDMVTCIRQDGNDGAHDGELGKDEAYDIMDFSYMVLEKIYTEPERIRISQERRLSRKQKT
ncbi:uncharacterized protein DUF4145 [Shewanella putrefaciens]|nr:uncharacterized protein DUF4145 [Shewanella putrefaciens]